MKIGVSSYSYNQEIVKKGNFTQYSTIDSAKNIGFETIEFTELIPHNGMTKKEYARLLKEHAKERNIEISAYLIGANMLKTDESSRKAEIKRVCEELDVAAELGVKLFRHDIGGEAKGFDLAIPQIAENVLEITKYAETIGIKTMSENHGYVFQNGERMEKLVNAVNHPNYGLLCDIGNFLCLNEDPVPEIIKIAPYTIHVHAKDFLINKKDICTDGVRCYKSKAGFVIFPMPVNEGSVPVRQCIEILKNAGYDGCINIEYEGELNCFDGIRRGYNNLKKIL